MNHAIKNAAGATLILSTASAIAQVKGPTIAACASCPPTTDLVIIPSDPTFLVAFGIFAIGLLAGVGLAKLLGRGRQQ